MSILCDVEINELCVKGGMISPYVGENVSSEGGHPVISYGLSSFGYDIRLGSEFEVFTPNSAISIDPKSFSRGAVSRREGEYCIIPPNGYMLSVSVERFKIPEDVMGVCVGKSTYARCGVQVNVTPLEAGWEGYVTLEFSNATPAPVKMYAKEGCCQIMFFRGVRDCATSYRGRKGKYQNQTGVTLPLV